MRIADLFVPNRKAGDKADASNANAGHVRNLGRISHTYQTGGLYGEFINGQRLKAWREAIGRFDIALDEVLDVGCAHGSWAGNWRELGFLKLCGIEPNEEVLEQARDAFDVVHHGFANELAVSLEPRRCVAANGVIVHILEDEAELEFLTALRKLCDARGHVCFSVINCRYYPTAGGRAPWTGPNSCTRTLAHHRALVKRAGLGLVGELGTFINPWALKEFDFTMAPEYRESETLYQGWSTVADGIRGRSLEPFSEVLMVTQPLD